MNINLKSSIGAFLILLGTLAFVSQYTSWDFSIGYILSTFWPSIIIVYGIKLIYDNEQHSSFFNGVIVLLLGSLLQANEFDLLPWGFWGTLWPLILIIIGASMIFGKSNIYSRFRPKHSKFSDDFISVNCIFSGHEQSYNSQQLLGGDINCTFGGAKLDLRNAQLSPEFDVLLINCHFGGIEIMIPPNWEVKAIGTPIFGGFEEKTRPSGVGESIQTLRIQYNVAFGGIEIRN